MGMHIDIHPFASIHRMTEPLAPVRLDLRRKSPIVKPLSISILAPPLSLAPFLSSPLNSLSPLPFGSLPKTPVFQLINPPKLATKPFISPSSLKDTTVKNDNKTGFPFSFLNIGFDGVCVVITFIQALQYYINTCVAKRFNITTRLFVAILLLFSCLAQPVSALVINPGSPHVSNLPIPSQLNKHATEESSLDNEIDIRRGYRHKHYHNSDPEENRLEKRNIVISVSVVVPTSTIYQVRTLIKTVSLPNINFAGIYLNTSSPAFVNGYLPTAQLEPITSRTTSPVGQSKSDISSISTSFAFQSSTADSASSFPTIFTSNSIIYHIITEITRHPQSTSSLPVFSTSLESSLHTATPPIATQDVTPTSASAAHITPTPTPRTLSPSSASLKVINSAASAPIPIGSSSSSSSSSVSSTAAVSPTFSSSFSSSFKSSATPLPSIPYKSLPMSFNPIYVPPTVEVAVNPNDPFSVPVATTPPNAQFQRVVHPLAPLDAWSASGPPISTNKFYTNLLLGNRTNPAYVEPYSVWQTNANGFFGLAVSSTSNNQLVFGPNPASNPAQYFFEPVGIMSVVLSAAQFTSTSTMNFHCARFLDYSVQAYFVDPTTNGQLWTPLVLGMGYVTGVYYDLTPVVASAVGFASIEEVTPAPQANMRKYALTLNNGVRWVLYMTVPAGSRSLPIFSLNSAKTQAICSDSIQGTVIQVGQYPANSDTYLDQTAGRYQTDAYVTGSVNGNTANVKIQYVAQGTSTSGDPLMYVPPHYEGVLSNMRQKQTNFQLRGPVLGDMYGYVSSVLEFQETLPTTIGFLPYSQLASSTRYDEKTGQASTRQGGLVSNERDEFAAIKSSAPGVSPFVSATTAQFITGIATTELQEDVNAQTNLNSMYFSGKGLDKFAQIVFTAKYILNNDMLALSGLNKLKAAFAVFAENHQQNPLAYDTTWKGLVSTAGLTDPNADFGNTYYNDHHFHYGYFVHAAAVIAQVDNDIGGGTWLAANKDYVNSMIRDVHNPTLADPYFPRFRSFDFYAGHSWAKGLFESADGKDEESSSEDYHNVYGMKLWASVIGDSAMEARANIMLAVMQHSLNSYMLFSNDNTIVPSQIVANKVSGICFENKIDYATYFGLNTEYIHGIHMIPITSVSSYIRGPTFVTQEWDQMLSTLAPTLTSGWKGILYQNLALINPSASYAMFSAVDFEAGWLDGGMSRTWALAYAAYVGNL